MRNDAPVMAFLGISENVSQSVNVDERFSSLNILNLRMEIISFIFPLNLSNFFSLFALYDIEKFDEIKIICKDNNQKQVFSSTINTMISKSENDFLEESDTSIMESFISRNSFWMVIPIQFPQNAIMMEPGKLIFYLRDKNIDYEIGSANCFAARARPLSDDQISALKSDPTAIKHIKFIIGCNKCKEELKVIAGLTKPELSKDEIWVEDLPNNFECKCKNISFNTSYIKNGYQHLINENIFSKKSCTITRQYERKTLRSLLFQYSKTLNQNPKEEIMQKFLEKHTILFHFFSPLRIINKAPILSKYVTDFVILSKNGTLNLIEIEKPDKLITTKKGRRTSDFNHPFDQVRDWLHHFKNHRFTVLDEWGINTKEVTKIKGIVIYGRDHNCKEDDLLKIKSSDFGEIIFYTYDDIANSLTSLIQDFDDI
ncbi:MAG: DUF4263 domain-containing protein [Candidatus Lokiarchaeota archaeon]|nr:DUF4263 domain-containing protein [Candidatus Lokiarchaeota archaeon]